MTQVAVGAYVTVYERLTSEFVQCHHSSGWRASTVSTRPSASNHHI